MEENGADCSSAHFIKVFWNLSGGEEAMKHKNYDCQ
jgi:hypothetical protein